MEPIEYIHKFNMDQDGPFDKDGFLDALGSEFIEALDNIKEVDPTTGVLPYNRFQEVVTNMQYKFMTIGNMKKGWGFSQGYWGAFYAKYIVSTRKRLYPTIQETIDKRRQKCSIMTT